jgi:hypothetical protein
MVCGLASRTDIPCLQVGGCKRELAAETEVLFEDRSRKVCFEDVSSDRHSWRTRSQRMVCGLASRTDIPCLQVGGCNAVICTFARVLQERRGSEKHAASVLGRSVRDQVALALASLTLERVVDDLELQASSPSPRVGSSQRVTTPRHRRSSPPSSRPPTTMLD